MNRKHDRASTPEDRLHDTLDTVAARPAPANAERLTRAMDFRRMGEFVESPSLFRVNPGIEAEQALSLAECLLCHLRSRFANAVATGEPIRGDEAYAFELLVDMVLALYASTGAHA